MNKTKDEIHDIEVDSNMVRFMRKKKHGKIYLILTLILVITFSLSIYTIRLG